MRTYPSNMDFLACKHCGVVSVSFQAGKDNSAGEQVEVLAEDGTQGIVWDLFQER